ncbi:MAG: class I SAM-dependent methyltransferase [Candidatus Calescibacterium sp.]|nr:class I SAM-dependent methyltransferase [Candidatus Calescibacterium sp.]MCX7734213.1 class I SAM-dependent methyltransferase [bacterium]MDW8087929.1 class I SAM-dependent methyltransferase [Candidatus Calescibacterium sp.]
MKKGWIYSENEIHRNWFEKLKRGDKKIEGRDWYFLIYEKKMNLIMSILKELRDKKILDAGCGEGVLVEEFRSIGYDIEGLDPNYESDFVRNGDITSTDYPNNHFDVVLLLDVLEHIPYNMQYKALEEIKRILKPDGMFIISFPNVANLSSRIKFALIGELSRTDKDYNHLGERTYKEIKRILESYRFSIQKIYSITPTIPVVWQLITLFPDRMRKIHDLINLIKIPDISLITIFICKNIK